MDQIAQPPINAATRLCAVFGSPIRHSASPAMHNAGFAALGLNFCYVACDVDPKNLRAAIDGAKAMNFAGLNLTVPHKLLALNMVDELDESARVWGAVNTIRFEGHAGNDGWRPMGDFGTDSPGEVRSVGFNTDADGLVAALREDLKIELGGKNVLLLGAGGAGRTAALRVAAEKAATLFLVNRTFAKVLEIQVEIQKKYPAVRVVMGYPNPPAREIDLVINATSLGLKSDDAMPLDASAFSLRPGLAVYDMIYRPAETPFLAAAKAADCRTANGLGMLLHQGARAFEIWTGRTAPIAVMRRVLEQNIYGH